MKCEYCNNEIPAGVYACPSCGAACKVRSVSTESSTHRDIPEPTQQPPVKMSFGAAIASCFSKYATCKGRARRREYWYFVLFNFLCRFIVGFGVGFLMVCCDAADSGVDKVADCIDTLFSIALFLPGLAVGVRRLHDTGRSGWQLLWAFLPIVGWIMIIVWMCSDGKVGANEYGEDPKGR